LDVLLNGAKETTERQAEASSQSSEDNMTLDNLLRMEDKEKRIAKPQKQEKTDGTAHKKASTASLENMWGKRKDAAQQRSARNVPLKQERIETEVMPKLEEPPVAAKKEDDQNSEQQDDKQELDELLASLEEDRQNRTRSKRKRQEAEPETELMRVDTDSSDAEEPKTKKTRRRKKSDGTGWREKILANKRETKRKIALEDMHDGEDQEQVDDREDQEQVDDGEKKSKRSKRKKKEKDRAKAEEEAEEKAKLGKAKPLTGFSQYMAKKRSRKLVTRSYVNEKGYKVTEDVWEEVSSEGEVQIENEAEQVQDDAPKPEVQTRTKQSDITSFFKK